MTIRSFFGQFKAIPHGFKQIFLETRDVVRLVRRVEKSRYSRREHEAIRQHLASWRKLGFFFLIQLPPLIGYIPMFVALKFPRQLLTPHFHDNHPEMLQSFLRDEFIDRSTFAQQLMSCFPATEKEKQKLMSLRDWHLILNAPKPSTFDRPRTHWTLLSKSNMLCDSISGTTVTPSVVLWWFMSRRAKEIVLDDQLLRRDGLDDMTLYELQIALLRRGFQPCEDIILLKTQLNRWLEEMVSEEDRREILSESWLAEDWQRSKSMALLHLIAHNSTLTPLFKQLDWK